MKKFNTFIFSSAIAVFILSGCNGDAEIPQPHNDGQTGQTETGLFRLTAATPETPLAETKAGWVETSGGRAIWHQGDQIGVSIHSSTFNGAEEKTSLLGSGLCLSQQGELTDNNTKASFTGQLPQYEVGGSIDYIFHCYYPHHAGARFVDSATPYFTIPVSSVQEYVPGGFKGIPMVAYNKGKADMSIKFNAVYSVIRLNISGNKNVKWIKVRGNDGEIMAGSVTVVPSAPISSTNPLPPAAGSDYVAVNFGDQGKTFATGENIYIYLPAQKYAKGLTVELFESSETGSYTLKTNNSLNLAAGRIYPLGNINLASRQPAISIPDDMFRGLLESFFEYISVDGNTITITDAGRNATELNVATAIDIKSLQGIEYFPNLETILCDGTGISSLDVSSNTALRTLDCSATGVTTLDLSKNSVLEELRCNDTDIETLNLKECPELNYLNCMGAKLSALDLSGNPQLRILICGDQRSTNALGTTGLLNIDVSYCPELIELDCSGNPGMKTVDTSNNTHLQRFISQGLAAEGATLDFSNNKELTHIYCSGMTFLRSLDVSMLSQLQVLNCFGCQLKSVDVSGLANLTTLRCYDLDGEMKNSEYYLQTLNISGAQKLNTFQFTSRVNSISGGKLTVYSSSDSNSRLINLIADGNFNNFTQVECRSHPTLTTISLQNSGTLNSVTVKNNVKSVNVNLTNSSPTVTDFDGTVQVTQ